MTIHCNKLSDERDGYTLCGIDVSHFATSTVSFWRFTRSVFLTKQANSNGDTFCQTCDKAAAAREARR
jgi:hypothetical protein